jgi:fatty acid desaturase
MSTSTTQQYWTLDGDTYDFTKFIDKHPGGRAFILLGKGRDCSELFHSVHALSGVDFKPILNKYKVNNNNTENNNTLFDWTEKSLFGTELRNEVKKYFKENNLSYKANLAFWLSVLAFFLFTVFCVYTWINSASIFFGLISGIEVIILGFFVMHTASHGALSFNPWINNLFTYLWCNFAYWNHNLWLQHHVYGHHSYTGLYGKDPDVRNYYPFARKHVEQKTSIFNTQQHWGALFFLLVLPNQYVGQIITYLGAFSRRTLFGMPIKKFFATIMDRLNWIVWAFSFGLLFALPLYIHGWNYLPSVYAYLAACGMTYWAIVFPNHDTEGVLTQAKNFASSDWAVLQLVHSSNFYLPYAFSQLLGGMNYQIEHHLFPSVHPIHYPEISKIVQRLAKKYNLPYLQYKSWFHSFAAHIKFLRVLGRIKLA